MKVSIHLVPESCHPICALGNRFEDLLLVAADHHMVLCICWCGQYSPCSLNPQTVSNWWSKALHSGGVHPCLGLSIVEVVIWLEYASFLPFIHPFSTFLLSL